MPLQVKFEQTAEMAADFALHYQRSNRGTKIMWAALVLMLLTTAFGPFFRGEKAWGFQEVVAAALPTVLILALTFYLYPHFMKWLMKRMQARQNVSAEREIIFNEHDFLVRTSGSEANIEYTALLKYGQSEANYFLYFASNQAFIIPKVAMTGEERMELEGILNEQEVPS